MEEGVAASYNNLAELRAKANPNSQAKTWES
jgi:hypothetical protein